MKLLAPSFAALALVLAACSINHRSGDFACTTQADCKAGLVCLDSVCVAPDSGGTVDASPNDGGGNVCPAQCTSCELGGKTCVIDCAVNPERCRTQITCPVGLSCNVKCSGQNDCRSGISCTGAKACTITCSGSGSCRDIACGSGACTVDCSGVSSCRNVSCGGSCACDVSCGGPVSCSGGLSCRSAACTQQASPFGCTSKPIGCNTCPLL